MRQLQPFSDEFGRVMAPPPPAARRRRPPGRPRNDTWEIVSARSAYREAGLAPTQLAVIDLLTWDRKTVVRHWPKAMELEEKARAHSGQ
jgi:hypothetical protein